MGVARTEIIGVLASLGVADELAGGPLTASELASRLSVDGGALPPGMRVARGRGAFHRVMRVAAADGLFKLDRQGRFKLTRFGKTLRSDSPATLRPWARYMALDSTRRAWAGLGDSVRTGHSAFERVNGSSIWDWFAAHPEEQHLFAAAMRSITEFDGPALAGSELVPDEGVVCDVAGGGGSALGGGAGRAA